MHTQETRIFFAIVTAVIILAILIIFFVVTIIRYNRKRVASDYERIMTDTLLLEKERARIAADLHDDIGAILSAIKIRLQCLDLNDNKDPLIIDEVENLIDDSMKKLREISYNMMPMVLQRKGLNEALNELIETLTIANRIEVKFEYNLRKLNNEKEIHIFRIVQEIISNTLKHAYATQVSISLKQAKETLQLHIRDNGIGFDKNITLKKNIGLGLQNITARGDILKAKIYLSTAIGKGVDFLIEIPDE